MQAMSIRIFLILSLFVLINPYSLTAATEQRIALVIGNSNYDVGRLKNPVNDATDMAAALKKLGFSVIIKNDAGHKEMETAIKEFGRQLKKDAIGLFFYAGHGVQIEGRNYLIPLGANIEEESDVEYKAVNLNRVFDVMDSAGNKLNIVILDACRDNPYAKSFRSSSRGLAIVGKSPNDTLIAYSTSPGQVASDGSGRNSPYTKALLDNIIRPGLSIEQVFKKVRNDLDNTTGGKQKPWYLASLGTDFYFNTGKVKKAAEILTKAEETTSPTDELEDQSKKLEAEQRRLDQEKASFVEQKALEEKHQQLVDERERLVAEQEEARQVEVVRKKKALEEKQQRIADERERLATEKEEARQAALERQKQKKTTILAKATPAYQFPSEEPARDGRYIAYGGQSKQETGFDDKEIRVAQWGPQTGPAAAWGSVARGSKLVFDIVNDEGGIAGRQIKYFIRDDQYNPSQTVAGVKELVEKHGIFAFVGGVSTASGSAVKDYLLGKEIIWISPCSGAPVFYKLFNPYLWNMWPSYENDASIIAKFAIEKKKFKKIAMFYQNDGYGLDALDSVKYRLSRYNMELVAAVPVEPTERDLSSHLAKIQASGAETVIAFVAPTQAAIALKTAVYVGFKTQWMHSYSLSDYGLMNKVTDGLWAKEGVITSAFTQEPFANNALTAKYTEAVKKYAPAERWSIFYMAGVVVAEPLVYALKKVGRNLSTNAVRDELNKIKNFQGLGPKVSWTANNHMGSKAVQIWQCGPSGEIITRQKWTENKLSRN